MKHVVFYDAECPLCSNAKKVIGKMDWLDRIHWIPVQLIEQTEYRSILNSDRNLYDEIHMLTSKGKVLAGFDTIRRILRSLPITFPYSWILYLPFMDKILSPLYMWISKNRYEWFGRYETLHIS